MKRKKHNGFKTVIMFVSLESQRLIKITVHNDPESQEATTFDVKRFGKLENIVQRVKFVKSRSHIAVLRLI